VSKCFKFRCLGQCGQLQTLYTFQEIVASSLLYMLLTFPLFIEYLGSIETKTVFVVPLISNVFLKIGWNLLLIFFPST
jgi:hypothetical protein